MGIRLSEHSIAEFERQFVAWMKEWHIPGAAITATYKGERILSKGYGVADVNKQTSVTEHSLFLLNSVTKSMTGFGAALLVSQGLCSWDTPIKSYIPELKLYDPIATELLTLRDMLCHRSGLPMYSKFWQASPLTRADMVGKLQDLPPNHSFRSIFQYNNLMYMLAGYVMEKLTGLTWEDYTKQHIFTPLGMHESQTSYEEVIRQNDVAMPHHFCEGEISRLEFVKLRAIAPAGGVYTSASDMAHWMDLVIRGESSLLDAASFREWLNPVIAVPHSRKYRELGGDTYAMGWRLSHYKGRHMVHHAGAGQGYNSECLIFPDDQAGVTVLMNTPPQPGIAQMAAYYLTDLMLGEEVTPWRDRLAPT